MAGGEFSWGRPRQKVGNAISAHMPLAKLSSMAPLTAGGVRGRGDHSGYQPQSLKVFFKNGMGEGESGKVVKGYKLPVVK